MAAKECQEDPLGLLDTLSKDKNVTVKHKKLPWDQDITLVDFYVKHGVNVAASPNKKRKLC